MIINDYRLRKRSDLWVRFPFGKNDIFSFVTLRNEIKRGAKFRHSKRIAL